MLKKMDSKYPILEASSFFYYGNPLTLKMTKIHSELNPSAKPFKTK
jgi:hypothetical protein